MVFPFYKGSDITQELHHLLKWPSNHWVTLGIKGFLLVVVSFVLTWVIQAGETTCPFLLVLWIHCKLWQMEIGLLISRYMHWMSFIKWHCRGLPAAIYLYMYTWIAPTFYFLRMLSRPPRCIKKKNCWANQINRNINFSGRFLHTNCVQTATLF